MSSHKSKIFQQLVNKINNEARKRGQIQTKGRYSGSFIGQIHSTRNKKFDDLIDHANRFKINTKHIQKIYNDEDYYNRIELVKTLKKPQETEKKAFKHFKQMVLSSDRFDSVRELLSHENADSDQIDNVYFDERLTDEEAEIIHYIYQGRTKTRDPFDTLNYLDLFKVEESSLDPNQVSNIAHDSIEETPPVDFIERLEDKLIELRYGLGERDEIEIEIDPKYRKYTFEKIKEAFKVLLDLPYNERLQITFEIEDEGINAARTFNLTPNNIKAVLKGLENDGVGIEFEEMQGSDINMVLSSLQLVNKITFRNKLSTLPQQERTYNLRGGAFFPYFNTSKINLSRYQIFTREQYKKGGYATNPPPCLVYALCRCNKLTDGEKLIIKHMVSSKFVDDARIQKIAQRLNIEISVCHLDDKPRTVNYKGVQTPPRFKISLNLFKNHYFIQSEISKKSKIKKVNPITGNPDKMNSRGVKSECVKESSRDLIIRLYQRGKFQPMTFRELTNIYSNSNERIDISKLTNEELELECKPIVKEKKRVYSSGVRSLWFADFETTTDGEIHRPYCACAIDDEGRRFKAWERPGNYCAMTILNSIEKNTPKSHVPVVYFHNLTYDINFMTDYITGGIKKGSKWLSADLIFNKRIIKVKDSLGLIPAPLRDFGKMFGLSVHKEIFPYQLFNTEGVLHQPSFGSTMTEGVQNSLKFTFDEWRAALPEYSEEEIFEALKRFDPFYEKDKIIYGKHYALFYCMKDVEVLRDGFNEFCKGVEEAFSHRDSDGNIVEKLDATKFITISSLANHLLTETLKGLNKGVVQYKGVLRAYIQQAVYGGRVMTSENKQFDLPQVSGDPSGSPTMNIADFDAVSLYPSAINRLSEMPYPIGCPKLIPEDLRDLKIGSLDIPNELTKPCIVDIEILKINKRLPFPLIVSRKEDGTNLNDDSDDMIGITMTVDDIYLRDLIHFQGCEVKILFGIYWPKTSNEPSKAMGELIRSAFSKRKEYKEKGNPIQNIYKLVLNSIYGKTVQKPISDEIKFIKNNKIAAYVSKNYHKIKYTEKVSSAISKTLETSTGRTLVKMEKQISEFKNNALLGVRILSMSKRIMHEVMTIKIRDKGVLTRPRIYYTDTDSMFIVQEDLDKLIVEYSKRYGRELVGNEMGQFHSDFPKGTHAVESVFLGKKSYAHRLSDGSFILKLKGVPNAAIWDAMKKLGYDSPIDVYRLMMKQPVEFNLLAGGKVNFKFENNLTVSSRQSFTRTLSFIA